MQISDKLEARDDQKLTLSFKNDETLALRGEFYLTIRNKKGEIVEEYADKNLIVNGGKTTLAKLLAGQGAAKFINRISFGTNGTAPDAADTVITNAVTRLVDAYTYPEFNSVAIAYTLPYTAANGLNISEFGLISQDDSLFARKTRTAIAKTSDLQFSGVWKIIF